jgi:hypothetical protein
MVKKLETINIIIISIVLIISLYSLFTIGFRQIIETFKTGSNGGIYFGFSYLIALILGLICLILEIKLIKSDNEQNKLIKSSYWINVIIFIIFILWETYIFCLGRVKGIGDGIGYSLSILFGIFIFDVIFFISSIIFFIGYYKLKE